jgi:hypothetical protein
LRLAPTALAVLLLCASCSLFTDLGGFTGGDGPDAAGPADGAAPPGQGASDAAGADVPDAPAATGCARFPGATYCNDFDRGDPLGPLAWTAVDRDVPFGSIDVVSDDRVSAPSAARVVVSSSDGCAFLTATRRTSGTFARVTARFAARPTTRGVFASFEAWVNDTTFYDVLLASDGPTMLMAWVQEHRGGVQRDLDRTMLPLPVSMFARWNELAFEVETAPSRSIVIRADNQTATLPMPEDFALNEPRLVLGSWCSPIPTEMRFDDVAIFATPP